MTAELQIHFETNRCLTQPDEVLQYLQDERILSKCQQRHYQITSIEMLPTWRGPYMHYRIEMFINDRH